MAHLLLRSTPAILGQYPQKRSILSNLKSTLLSCSSGNKDDDDVCNSAAEKIEEIEQPHSSPSKLSEHELLPGMSQAEPESDDDDISVISLGEARRLAQLRIDGVGLSTASVSPYKITDALSKHASTSTGRQVIRALPPIEPVYRKKAMVTLKKALRRGKVADCSNTCGSSKKKAKKEPKVSRKEQVREKRELHGAVQNKKQLNWSKDTVTSWLDKKYSSTKLQSSLENVKAKEHSKVAELHRRISEMEQKRNAKQKELSVLTQQGHEDSKPQIKKLKKSLRATDRKLRKLSDEVQALENNLQQLSSRCTMPTHISESVQTKSDNRAVSDTNTTQTSITTRIINVVPGPQTTSISFEAQQCTTVLPSRPSTAVRMFLLPPDKTTVTPRERMVSEMMKVEQKAQEAMFERPRAAHPARVRSLTENVQEFLPYDLEHFESDSEDEEPARVIKGVGEEGMRRFEQLQNAKDSDAATLKRHSVSFREVVETESEDEFEFVCESAAPCTVRPPTRCTNGMAKQILQESPCL